MKAYSAQIVEDNERYAIVMFPMQLRKCSECRRPMMRNDRYVFNLTPEVLQIMQAAGLARYSDEIDGRQYCETCIEAGKGEFECAMCNRMRPLNQLVPDVGYEYDRLCTVCFSSVSAAEWAVFIDKLDDAHQWDHS